MDKVTTCGVVVFRVNSLTPDVIKLRTTEDVFLLAWGSDSATSRLVRITASGLRSSCDASWMKRRWLSKAASRRASIASNVSAS